MKYFLIAATLLTLTACCGCMDKPGATAAPHHATNALSCSTAKVSGMTCDACAVTITENLKKHAGVKDTKIDVASGTVRIYADKSSAPDSAKVKSVIEKSGYEFKSLTPNCN